MFDVQSMKKFAMFFQVIANLDFVQASRDEQGLATFLIQRSNDFVFSGRTHSRTRRRNCVGLSSCLQTERRTGAVLRVTTSNDNLNTLRFYQRRGFRITRVRPGVVNEARRIKPPIPVVGEHGILIRDEIDLERRVDI